MPEYPATPVRLLPRLLLLAVAGYLVVDFTFIHGPVHRWIGSKFPAQETPAARVAGFPITRSQLDRAVHQQLRLLGKTPSELTPDALAATRKTALDDLIDDALLRLQTRALEKQLAVTEAELDSQLARFTDRFESPAALAAAMKSQGIADDTALRARLAARIRQEKFLALRLSPATRVSDEEAREWFEKNGHTVATPERVEARHLFIATLDHPPEEAKQTLEAALAGLAAKKTDFPTLARELSEDPSTKDNGGALGWLSRERLPADFAAPLFSLETNRPALVRTRLGWHLVEVTARKPAEPTRFELVKPEIIAALEAKKRRSAIADLRKSLRARESASIEIFPAT